MRHKPRLLSAILAAGMLAVAAGALQAQQPQRRTQRRQRIVWTRLYDGTLTGWHAKDGSISHWHADGPVLSVDGGGGGWLTTDKQYGDFELQLDYRILSPGGNSGVGLRFPAEGDPAHEGMEIQILDDPAPEYKGLDPAQFTGGIYFQAAPTAHPAKPVGQWNHYDIRCEGSHVAISLNGVKIQDVNLDDDKEGRGGHKALAVRPRSGYIGLQSHTGKLEFTLIKIHPIVPGSPAAGGAG